VTPRGIRLAVRRALGSPRMRARVAEVAAWTRTHDGAARAADLVERFGATRASLPVSA
jgi:UDP:flavonoid glycosyltransferase YjiC (YdhE family)